MSREYSVTRRSRVLLAGTVVGWLLAFGMPAGAASATPAGLSCWTGVHNNDDYTGFAFCTNNGTTTKTFWVHLVCGWAWDQDGNAVTLRPGESGQSTAHCGTLGSGVGEIHVHP